MGSEKQSVFLNWRTKKIRFSHGLNNIFVMVLFKKNKDFFFNRIKEIYKPNHTLSERLRRAKFLVKLAYKKKYFGSRTAF